MPSRRSMLRVGLIGSLTLFFLAFGAMVNSLSTRTSGGWMTAATRAFEEPFSWLLLCIPTGVFWIAIAPLRGRGARKVLIASIGSAVGATLIAWLVAGSRLASTSSTDTSFAAAGDALHVALIGVGSGWIVGLTVGSWVAVSKLRDQTGF